MVGNEASRNFYITVGENIKKYRLIRNYSQEILGEMLGVQKKAISNYEAGQVKIDMHRLADVAEALNVSMALLLAGTEAFLGVRLDVADIIKIPILGFVPAGGPVMVEENLEGYIDMARKFIKGDNDFALRIRGDSMDDVDIHDGDMVLVHPQPVAENGQTVIARVDGEVTCKRFYRSDGHCRLEPANSKYKPILCDKIEVIGIVTNVIKEVV
jgi:repressor LexA